MIKKILSLALLTKITILVLIFLAYNLLPFNRLLYNSNFTFPENEKVSLVSAYKTWDAQHYLYLSGKGYSVNGQSNRFFPLLPIAISIINIFLRNSLVSGLLISNFFSFIGIVYFYLLCKLFLKDEKKALTSVILLISFPTAFFMSLIYSESILFFLTSAFFYYLYSKKYFLASVFAFFIPLTRPVGIFIIFPYFTYWLFNAWTISKSKIIEFVSIFLTDKKTYYLITPFLGFFIYLNFMQITTGSFFEGFKAQSFTVSSWNMTNILDPIYFIVNLFPSSLSIHGFTNSIIDRIFFVIYCILLVFIYRRLDKTMFIYSLALGMVPLFGSFMSYTRYVLMVFPVFIVMSEIFSIKKLSIFFYPTVFLMIMLQALFLIMHSLNYWVA